MPTYVIEGKKVQTDSALTDDEIDEIAATFKKPAERPSLPIRVGANVWEGAAAIPGLPVEIAALAKGIPVEQSNLAGWGAKGWSDFFDRNIPGGLPSRKLPAPADEGERMADKAGQFLGGGAVFGPSAMASAGTSFLGSEIGRAADNIAPEFTGGYGEVVGGVAGGLYPAIRQGQVTAAPRAAPTAGQLKDTARAFYDQADNAQVVLNQAPVNNVARRVRGDLGRMAYTPKLQPKIGTLLDELDVTLQGGDVTLQGIDNLRKMAGNIARDGNPTEMAMASKVIEHIDDVIDNLKPSDIVAGNADDAVSALKSARDNWRRASKGEMIQDAIDRAVLRADSTGTGGNTENAIRQNIRAILDNKKKVRLFTKEEQLAMVRVVRGGPVQNFMRLVGGLSPDKGFFPMVAALGATAMNPAGIVLPAVGLAGRAISEGIQTGNVNRLSDLVRAGRNLPQASTAQRAAQVAQELTRRGRIAATPGTVAPLANLPRNMQEQD